jgi:hypothetical protein
MVNTPINIKETQSDLYRFCKQILWAINSSTHGGIPLTLGVGGISGFQWYQKILEGGIGRLFTKLDIGYR